MSGSWAVRHLMKHTYAPFTVWEGMEHGNTYFVMLRLRFICYCTQNRQHCAVMHEGAHRRGPWRLLLVNTVCTLTLTSVDHWLKLVKTTHFLLIPARPYPTPHLALGFGAGWRTAQRTTWAAVPHWPRVTFAAPRLEEPLTTPK